MYATSLIGRSLSLTTYHQASSHHGEDIIEEGSFSSSLTSSSNGSNMAPAAAPTDFASFAASPEARSPIQIRRYPRSKSPTPQLRRLNSSYL